MAHRSALVAVSTAQLAAQLVGHVVAVRRRRHFDVPFMTGSPEEHIGYATASGSRVVDRGMRTT